LDIEEDERKFIFSYGVGEASVETKDGTLVIPNVYYTPEITMNVLNVEQLEKQITMNVLNVEQLEKQGYVVTYERNKCGIRYMFDEGEGMIDAQGDNVMVYENLASMIESHNKFLDEYFESIDPKEECSLIKGMEDLKMEKHRLMLQISVALLPITSGLHPLLNLNDFLSRLLYYLWTGELNFSNLSPTNRRTTFSTLKCLKGCSLNASMITVIADDMPYSYLNLYPKLSEVTSRNLMRT
ncbi:hypothetical protein Tco_0027888, partial [Tanacetum coccineum]